jgi:hypothetical protein
MSTISGNLNLFRSADAPTPAQTAEEALRRLDLRPAPGRRFPDLVQIDASSLQILTRQLDNEWEQLDSSLVRGNIAVSAIFELEQSLADLKKLVQTNTRPGASPSIRKNNQKEIDAILKKIDKTINTTVDVDDNLIFQADAPLLAGKEKLPLDGIDLKQLGRSIIRGRQVALEDLASRRAHDTSTRRNPAARRLVERALDAVQDLRKKTETFVRENVHPRLGDVAEVTAGLMETITTDKIGSGDEAVRVARELRTLTLKSTATATAIGADGWDRERIERLLT